MIICGKNTVFEAIRTKRNITKIIILESNKELIKKVNGLVKTEIETMTLVQMNKICSDNHQGIIAYTEEYKYVELPNLINKNENKDAVIVMLANLEDPHNLGAILRTADATLIDGIIIPKNRSVDEIMTSLAKDNYIDVVISDSKKGYFYCVMLKNKGVMFKKDLQKQKKELGLLLLRTLCITILSFVVGLILRTIFT